MAELSPMPPSNCCADEQQAGCCGPEDKAGCCTPRSESCGCSTGERAARLANRDEPRQDALLRARS